MGNLFVEAILSSDTSTADVWFNNDSPDVQTLLNLFATLSQSQDHPRIQTLITTLQGNARPELLSMLIGQLPNVDLVQRLLRGLSESGCQRVYQRLFETADAHPLWLPGLLSFILDNHDLAPHHARALANTVLLSAVTCSETQHQALSRYLDNETLVRTCFELRAQAAIYSGENARFVHKRRLLLENHNRLTGLLADRASASTEAYQELIAHNSELANLLMSKRLMLSRSPENDGHLLQELFVHARLFNWQDATFYDQITTHLLRLFINLPANDRRPLFRQYADMQNQQNPDDIILFLNTLFAKTADVASIIQLVGDCDNDDNTLTINLIMQQHSQHADLLERLLNRLDASQLIELCGPILALQHLQASTPESQIAIHGRVLMKKIRRSKHVDKLLTQWATVLAQLPMSAEFITTNSTYLQKQPDKQRIWITTLLAQDVDPALLLQPIQTLPKVMQQHVLQTMPPSSLRRLFDHMNDKAADLTMFVSFFSDPGQQSALPAFLLAAPVTNQTFLTAILPLLNNDRLVSLAPELLVRAQSGHDYHLSRDMVLQWMCKRLLSYAQYPDNILHQWVHHEQHRHMAMLWLRQPDCFRNLCWRSSHLQDVTPNLLQGILVSNPKTDLKLRLSRVLDCLVLSDAEAEDMVLRLFHRFHETPRILQTMFVNIQGARPSFGEQAETNYRRMLQAAWRILQPPSVEACRDEAACVTLLTSQLTQAHRFDYLLTTLLTRLDDSGDPQQSACYLTSINTTAMTALSPGILANTLCHSVQESTASNWSKLQQHLDNTGIERNRSVINALIDRLRLQTVSGPPVETAHATILALTAFHDILPGLSRDNRNWLVQHCPKAVLMERFATWLDSLLRERPLNPATDAAMLLLLPGDAAFLNALYERVDMRPHWQTLFVQFARQNPFDEACTPHFIALFHHISQLDDSQKQAFLDQTHPALRHHTEPAAGMVVAPVLNMLLLDQQAQRADDPDHQTRVFTHLDFLTRITEAVDAETEQGRIIRKKSEQLILNTFRSLHQRDQRWGSCLFGNKRFSKAIALCLTQTEERPRLQHPLTDIILEQAGTTCHPTLQRNPAWQRMITSLLSTPPAGMDETQFHLLFTALPRDVQRTLAQTILQRPALENVQWFSLVVLSQALPVTTLYEIFTRSNTRFVFVDLLFRHPQGIDQLSQKQRQHVLDELNSAEQVWRILNSQCPDAAKLHFVQALFQYVTDKRLSLKSWINRVGFDAQTLTALAGFTVLPQQKAALQQVIQTSRWRQQELQTGLLHPLTDTTIQPSSLLYDIVENAWLAPERGLSCHPSLFAILPAQTAQVALQRQFQYWQDRQQLDGFYAPLTANPEAVSEWIVAANWIDRLPLLTSGLLDVLRDYDQSRLEERRPVETTRLYQKLIHPLLHDQSTGSSRAVTNLAQTWIEQGKHLLEDYQTQRPSFQIQSTLERFERRSRMRSQISPEHLARFFNPDAPLVTHVSEEEARLLARARVPLQQTLSESHGVSTNTLHHLLKLAQTTMDDDTQTWLLHSVLLSPLFEDQPPERLYEATAFIPLPFFMDIMSRIWQNLQTATTVNALLHPVIDVPRPVLIDALLNLSPKQLESCATIGHLLQLPYLHALSNLLRTAQQIRLTPAALTRIFPDADSSHGLELSWVRDDILQISTRMPLLLARCKDSINQRLYYRPDAANPERLSQLVRNRLRCDPARCLNHYRPIFEDNDVALTDSFLTTLTQLLAYPEQATELLNDLDPSLIDAILRKTLHDPLRWEELLRQLLMLESGTRCVTQVRAHLQKRLALLPGKPLSLEQLTLDDLAAINETDIDPLVIVQRLLYYRTPISELQNWRAKGREMPEKKRAFFCADASLLFALNRIAKQPVPQDMNPATQQYAQRCLEQGFSVLKRCSGILSYHAAAQTLGPGQAVVYGHYLFLITFLTNNQDHLLNACLSWLQGIPASDLTQQPELEACLLIILEQGLFGNLCQLLKQRTSINEKQRAWLFGKSLSLQPDNEELIQTISLACPWPQLMTQLKTARTHHRLWLGRALTQDEHVQAILETPQSRLQFLNWLRECQISINDALYLCEQSLHPALISLLATHVVNRPDYAPHGNLQAFCQRIRPTDLPVEALRDWLPEAATVQLMSVQQAHLLDETSLSCLLQALGSRRSTVLHEWLHRHTTMPNCERLLGMILRHHPKRILPFLAQASTGQRQTIMRLLIKQGQLASLPVRALATYCDETCFQFAVARFWREPQPDAALTSLVKAIVRSLLTSDTTLSPAGIQALVRLGEHPAFTSIRPQLDKACGDYLKHHAQYGDDSVFYDNGRCNIDRMNRIISLNTEPVTETKSAGVLQRLRSAWGYWLPSGKPGLPVDEETDAADAPVNSLSAFNYFLIHYQGNAMALERCLDDYFGQFNDTKPDEWPQSLSMSVWLLNQDELPEDTRSALFGSLLRHSHLLHGVIATRVCQYNARSLLRHFGMNKQYERLQELVSQALNADDPSQPLLMQPVREHMQRASRDAAFEASLKNIHGFFSGLRIWFRRRQHYGWFRSSQSPFVCPFDQIPARTIVSSSATALQGLRQAPPATADQTDLLAPPHRNDDLPGLQRWYQALLIHDSEEWQPGQDLALRNAVNERFQALLQRAAEDDALRSWLDAHMDLLIDNRRILLTWYWQNGPRDTFQHLLTQACEGPGSFESFAKAIAESAYPEPLPEESRPPAPPSPLLPIRLIGGLFSTVGSSLSALGRLGVDYLRPSSSQS